MGGFKLSLADSSMKGEGKMVSKMKWVGLVGLVLSAFSLFTHFLLARFSEEGVVEYQSSITLFSWRPIFETAFFPRTVMCKCFNFFSFLFPLLLLLYPLCFESEIFLILFIYYSYC